MKTGDKAEAAPAITGLDEWVEGTVIEVKTNPFLGIVVAIKDSLGRIFFGEEKYFRELNNGSCLQ
ncbi:MAG: transcriptional regulator [Prolixibacteraceae bacterium]|nr:transcriptional regulator [Prolixibacteraceae bacterium]